MVAKTLFILFLLHMRGQQYDVFVWRQILTYYLLDVMGEYRGVPGMILASVFAAALR